MKLKRTYWDNLTPRGETLDQIIYNIRKEDAGQGLLLDSVSMADIYQDCDGLMILDALTAPKAKLERKMNLLGRFLSQAGNTLNVQGDDAGNFVEISESFTKNGVANIAALYKLSDGQTITVFFHNPDSTPKKLAPTDVMISWKFLLNKRDITIAVAPEAGKDLDVKQVALRVMRLAEKNSNKFKQANAKASERAAQLESSKNKVAQLQSTLTDKQNELEGLKAELLSKQAVPQPEPTIEPTPEPVIEPVIEPAVTPEPETVQPVGQIDPATLANLNAASISAAIRKKAIAFFEKNPSAKSFEGSGLRKASQKAIMESIKTALFAEIKALSPLFEISDTKATLRLNGDILSVSVSETATGTGSFISFTVFDDENENGKNLFDSTTTLEDLRSWGFALPFDLDVRLFVQNVIKPVVDEFLSKQQEENNENNQSEIASEQAQVSTNSDLVNTPENTAETNTPKTIQEPQPPTQPENNAVPPKMPSNTWGTVNNGLVMQGDLYLEQKTNTWQPVKPEWIGKELPDDWIIRDVKQAKPSMITQNKIEESISSLRLETDMTRFNDRLDELADYIESVGLMEQYDKELNELADIAAQMAIENSKKVGG